MDCRDEVKDVFVAKTDFMKVKDKGSYRSIFVSKSLGITVITQVVPWLQDSIRMYKKLKMKFFRPIPVDKLIFEPGDELTMRFESATLVIRLPCKYVTHIPASDGGGIYSLSTKHEERRSYNYVKPQEASDKYRFKAIVILPRWLEKRHLGTVYDWYMTKNLANIFIFADVMESTFIIPSPF